MQPLNTPDLSFLADFYQQLLELSELDMRNVRYCKTLLYILSDRIDNYYAPRVDLSEYFDFLMDEADNPSPDQLEYIQKQKKHFRQTVTDFIEANIKPLS